MRANRPFRIVVRYLEAGWIVECDGEPFRIFRTVAGARETAEDLAAKLEARELVIFTREGEMRSLATDDRRESADLAASAAGAARAARGDRATDRRRKIVDREPRRT